MKTSDFDYNLPKELIALEPLADRSASRLLHVDKQSGALQHRIFKDISSLLRRGDVIVFNNSKVIPARIYGRRVTGGKMEMLVERVDASDPCRALAHIKSGKAPKVGDDLILDQEIAVRVLGREGALFIVQSAPEQPWMHIMEDIGHIPLPPYIERPDRASDIDRYQTVYADDNKAASVAAPTAGLHFNDILLDELSAKGVESAYVTLHVGAGTFQPLRTGDDEDPRSHIMHQERIEVSPDLCQQINTAKAEGRRIIAVGTTAVRSLESAWSFDDNQLMPFEGETGIFITPGYQFGCIDGLITNFHFPKTTLLMLVSAFAGHEVTMKAYEQAVAERYRFFSYGDAMCIL